MGPEWPSSVIMLNISSSRKSPGPPLSWRWYCAEKWPAPTKAAEAALLQWVVCMLQMSRWETRVRQTCAFPPIFSPPQKINHSQQTGRYAVVKCIKCDVVGVFFLPRYILCVFARRASAPHPRSHVDCQINKRPCVCKNTARRVKAKPGGGGIKQHIQFWSMKTSS